MDGERRACTRATCGSKGRCTHINRAANRTPPAMSTARPGAAPIKPVVSPHLGCGMTSTQILYVEPNFSETPSEYDIFYDCYSDDEINQTNNIAINAVISTSKSGSGPVASTPPRCKDSKMFRDALKQVIVNAQALLVEFESGGRGARRGCGSRCRCDVRNIKPQTRILQLEVTAKVAGNKSTPTPNIRIDPITFTIPLKLHLQGNGNQSQQHIAYTPSQLSYEGRRQERDHGVPCMYNSIEPIRTAIITGTRPQAVNCASMEGPGPDFDLHAAFLQRMAGLLPGQLQFPIPGVQEFSIPMPPQSQVGTSKVQIQAHAPAPLPYLDVRKSQSKPDVDAVCSRSKHQAPASGPFTTPSHAPVNKSSMPSVTNVKSETESRGLCVLCGKRGECACKICSKGMLLPPSTTKQTEPPMAPQKKGACGKASDKLEDDYPTISLVVLVPPQQKEEDSKGFSGGPCGMCMRGGKAAPPPPPPLEEPLIKVKGPCGKCTKIDNKSIEQTQKMSTPNVPSAPKQPGGSCGVCSLIRVPPRMQQSKRFEDDVEGKRCKMCARNVEPPAKLVNGLCGDCSVKAAAAEQVPPMEAASVPSGICSMTVQKGPFGVRGAETFPMAAKKEPCDICSKGAPPPSVVGKPSCAICSKDATTPITIQKAPCAKFGKIAAPSAADIEGPCGVCGRGTAPSVTEAKCPCGKCGPGVAPSNADIKVPCGVCGRDPPPPKATEVKGPCRICGRGPEASEIIIKGPCGVCSKVSTPALKDKKSPCIVCSRGAAPPPLVEKGPCGICSRSAAPASKPVIEKGPCGICTRSVATPPPLPEKGPCGICSRVAAAPATADIAPCEIKTSSSAPSVMSMHKQPCDICSRAAEPQKQEAPKTPCNICKKEPVAVSPELCHICKRVRTAQPEIPIREPCDICSKLAGSSFEHTQAVPSAVVEHPIGAQPCGKYGAVGAQDLNQTAPSKVATSSNTNRTCGKCFLPIRPTPATQASPCLSHTQPSTPSTTCGTCLTSQPPSPPPTPK
ncbi:uncharacterized protein [Eurosta solidaginis]|uniref:uncharacterized protein isoform X2 n=1 Tax=Eurosta solidaginis TaxID=178769 RepID=UPI0035307B3C